jgi:hypothetical protein
VRAKREWPADKLAAPASPCAGDDEPTGLDKVVFEDVVKEIAEVGVRKIAEHADVLLAGESFTDVLENLRHAFQASPGRRGSGIKRR